MDGISRGFILRLPNSCLSRQIFPFSTPREGTPGSLAKPLVVSPLRHCKRRPEDIRSPRFSDSVARPPLVTPSLAATPLVTGLAVAAAALGSRRLIQAWHAFKARPSVPVARRFYPGGFQHEMTKREAALILGVREHAPIEKIREAHRKMMVANHPDSGGSHFLASKINQAKDILTGKSKVASSAF